MLTGWGNAPPGFVLFSGDQFRCQPLTSSIIWNSAFTWGIAVGFPPDNAATWLCKLNTHSWHADSWSRHVLTTMAGPRCDNQVCDCQHLRRPEDNRNARVRSNSEIRCLAQAEDVWLFFHCDAVHICSSADMMSRTNVAPLRREAF